MKFKSFKRGAILGIVIGTLCLVGLIAIWPMDRYQLIRILQAYSDVTDYASLARSLETRHNQTITLKDSTNNTLQLRIHPEVELFLHPHHVTDQMMTRYKPPFGIGRSGNTVEEILNKTKRYGLDTDSPSRCVVVGNGHVLKGRGLGHVIDEHDVIFRLNDSPIRGYEQDVGRRTSVRVLYPESSAGVWERHGDASVMAVLPFKMADLEWLRDMVTRNRSNSRGLWRKAAVTNGVPATQVRILNPHFSLVTARDLLGLSVTGQWTKLPTTGLIVVVGALHACRRVSVAGFGYPIGSPQAPVHYYGTDRMVDVTKGNIHKVSPEVQIIHELSRIGVITNISPLIPNGSISTSTSATWLW